MPRPKIHQNRKAALDSSRAAYVERMKADRFKHVAVWLPDELTAKIADDDEKTKQRTIIRALSEYFGIEPRFPDTQSCTHI